MKHLRYQRGKWSLFAALALFVLLSASVGTAVAADSKGKVETSEPGFWATRDGNRVDLSIGDDIYEFDILKTDEKGGGTIRFIDDTVLEIRNSSEIDVKEVVFTEERNRFNVGVVEGTARVITGAIVRQNPRGFKVTTPRSTIGIRGTELGVTHDTEKDKTTVGVGATDKQVDVTSTTTGDTVTLGEGDTLGMDGTGSMTMGGTTYGPGELDKMAAEQDVTVTTKDGTTYGSSSSPSGSSGGTTGPTGPGKGGDGKSGGTTGGNKGGKSDCSNSNSSPSN